MRKVILVAIGLLLVADVGRPADASAEAAASKPAAMNPPAPSLGYVIVYVKDVAASLSFYEKAFGLTRRFFSDDNGMAYGELETGAARLAFASVAVAKAQLKQDVNAAAPEKASLGVEIALVTTDVPAFYNRALKAGAVAVSAPETKPWGQTVAYVRDDSGFLVELCTPMP